MGQPLDGDSSGLLFQKIPTNIPVTDLFWSHSLIPSMQIVYVLLLAFWTSAEVLSQKSKHAPVDAAVGHSSFPEPASNSKVAALLSRSVADGGRVNQQTLDSAVSG